MYNICIYENKKMKIKDRVLTLYTTGFADVAFQCFLAVN